MTDPRRPRPPLALGAAFPAFALWGHGLVVLLPALGTIPRGSAPKARSAVGG